MVSNLHALFIVLVCLSSQLKIQMTWFVSSVEAYEAYKHMKFQCYNCNQLKG